MRTMAFVIALALLFLSSCSGSRATSEKTDPTPPKVDPTSEKIDPELEQAKQDIYRVVASQTCGYAIVYIYPEVERYPLYGSEIEYALKQLPGASPETWDSYRLVNDPNQQIATFSDFPINCQYEFVSPTHVVCAGGDTDCIIPYGFSAIGFNKAGTQALVYMYRDCSECGGGGSIYLLAKREGSWVIINSVVLSVS